MGHGVSVILEKEIIVNDVLLVRHEEISSLKSTLEYQGPVLIILGLVLWNQLRLPSSFVLGIGEVPFVKSSHDYLVDLVFYEGPVP